MMVAARQASGLVLFLAALAVWNIFFSPLYSAAPALILAFGLILPPVGGAEPTRSTAPVPAATEP